MNFSAIDFRDSSSIVASPFIFFLAVIVAILSCIIVKLLIQKYQDVGRLDVPNQRSMHISVTPTGAGIVIAGFLLLVSIYLTISLVSVQFFAFTVVIFMLAFVGWQDDKSNLSISSRLTTFLVLSLITVLAVGVVDQIKLGQTYTLLLPFPIAALLTVLGFIWLLNLYNFMDGMDGLAAMQTIIAASAFLVIFSKIAFFENNFFDELTYSSSLALFCIILIAATVGFLVWNWSPAKIFLGDVGSLPVGGFFALCTIIAVKHLDVSLFSCFLILGVFIFDATYTLISRKLRGEKITEAHRSHIYQRLAGVGLSHRLIVTVYSAIMMLLSSAAILWEWQLINGVFTSALALISVLFMLLWVKRLERSV